MKRIGRQRWFFVVVLAGLAMLSLAMMIQLLGATSLRTQALEERPFAPPPPTTLTGWLTVIWGDGLPGTPALPPLYHLSLADGRLITLRPATEELGLLDWAGKQVSVSGEFAHGRSLESEEGDFVVTAVQPLQLRSSDDAVVGTQPWVSILCKFADYPDEPQPLSYFEEMYSHDYPGLDHYWREVSYDEINLENSAAFGWYTLPYTREHYVQGDSVKLQDLFHDCTAVADPDIDFSQFAGINLMFNESFAGFAYGGRTYAELDGEERPWPNTWIPSWGFAHQTLVVHEMGHAFGLVHSLDPYGYEYGNEWDVMSGIWSNCNASQHPVYGCLGQHTIAYYKEVLGWLPADKQVEISQGQHVTVALERLAEPNTADPLMAKILLGGPGTRAYFTVEARRQFAYDVKLAQSAVVIHQTSRYFHQAQAVLSGTLGVSDTYHDIPGQITVTVLSESPSGYVIDVHYAAFSCAHQTDLPVSECEALIELYNQTGGDNWQNNANWLYGSPCAWSGVICENGHVFQLFLSYNNLTGNIPTALTDLPHLDGLWINENNFDDSVPGWLFTDLPNLHFLDLSGNGLTGTLPLFTGGDSNLKSLILRGNELTGTIPSEFGVLTGLLTLDLSGNQLSGSLPAVLGNLVDLQFLSVANNQLSGSLPNEYGNLTKLVALHLHGNQLNGDFPTAVTQMSSLQALYMYDNQFTGSLPATIGNLEQLSEFVAFNNQFSGELPTELNLLTQLFVLDLSHNQLTGSLPLFSDAYLSILLLANNAFTGTIPTALFDSPSFNVIDLSQNHLEGDIPAVITHSLYLHRLDVSQNRLSGSLPAELGNLEFLADLDVSNNQFEGDIPPALTSMVNLSALDVGHNKLIAHDETVQQFLASHDPDWQTTQTVPPTAVRVSNYTTISAQLVWHTIPYTVDGGFYEISYALAPTGSYTVHGVTADKNSNSYLLDGLQPDTPYYFQIRTFTPAHDSQQSDLWSHYSNRTFIPVMETFLPLIRKP